MKKCIHNGELRQDVSDENIELIERLLDALPAAQVVPTPRIMQFDVSDGRPEDCWKYDIEIEVAPGVILPVLRGNLEDMDEDEPTDEEVVEQVMAGLAMIAPQLPHLTEMLHQGRMTCRRVIARWNDVGASARFVDVHLAPYEGWQGAEMPQLRIVLERLGDNFEPILDKFQTTDLSTIEQDLEYRRERLTTQLEARRVVMEEGADAVIDQLAINAMARFVQLDQDVRQLRTDTVFWLPDDACISITNGHVQLSTADDEARIQWLDDTVAVRRLFIPGIELIAAIGRPVSDIFEHEYLSSDMIVEEAECDQEDGQFTLHIRFSQPTRPCCLVSGRIWNRDDASDQSVRETATMPSVGTPS